MRRPRVLPKRWKFKQKEWILVVQSCRIKPYNFIWGKMKTCSLCLSTTYCNVKNLFPRFPTSPHFLLKNTTDNAPAHNALSIWQFLHVAKKNITVNHNLSILVYHSHVSQIHAHLHTSRMSATPYNMHLTWQYFWHLTSGVMGAYPRILYSINIQY